MSSNHPILCRSLLLLPSVFPRKGCQLFALGGQSIRASTSVLPMNIQDWFPLGLTDLITLQSKGLLRVFSSTTTRKHQFIGSTFFMVLDLPNQPAALKPAAWFQTTCTCSPILCDSVLEMASLFIHLSKSPLWSGGLPRPRPTKDPQRSSIGLIMAQTKMGTEGQPGCVRGSVPGPGGFTLWRFAMQVINADICTNNYTAQKGKDVRFYRLPSKCSEFYLFTWI